MQLYAYGSLQYVLKNSRNWKDYRSVAQATDEQIGGRSHIPNSPKGE